MKNELARRLLDSVGLLRHPCDLDLLLFFVRHPRTLMSSEQLAAFLGYDLKRISESLEVLLEARLLRRTPNPAHAARMYVFAVSSPNGGWLPALLDLASTQNGRLMLRRELKRRVPDSAGEGQGLMGDSRPRPILVGRRRDYLGIPDQRARRAGNK